MREIKFRAWNKGDNEMISWELFNTRKALNDYEWENMADWFNGEKKYVEWMQFTGLKDKNGKEIYEGDIMRMFIFGTATMPLEIITSVMFHEGVFAVISVNKEPLSLRDAIKLSNKTNQGLEIIGNVFENQELLTNQSHN